MQRFFTSSKGEVEGVKGRLGQQRYHLLVIIRKKKLGNTTVDSNPKADDITGIRRSSYSQVTQSTGTSTKTDRRVVSVLSTFIRPKKCLVHLLLPRLIHVLLHNQPK